MMTPMRLDGVRGGNACIQRCQKLVMYHLIQSQESMGNGDHDRGNDDDHRQARVVQRLWNQGLLAVDGSLKVCSVIIIMLLEQSENRKNHNVP